ncbi:putative phosphoesterase [Tistlia consotensis]|uniref:Putative phosphoesterase n=1 Tax=Tistlia consotensis USBA 355 TaxID=560819 RepID=A0A1Y6CFG6_9PROT|nr:ligase-associated DNA damage response endonuclease PdeM [Tistlia consotensis]SMF53537.1 putative phosphoesterase [Tistlia consotensis USBA 355]SNR85656.1 putative phosphoesterase [Tistlia consotensis]
MPSVLDSSQSSATVLTVAGATLMPEPSGALWWPERELLVVADLHLEKGTAFARRGQLLPPYDTAATLERLAEALRRRRPRRLVCLGDSFHDREAAERLAPEARALIGDLAATTDWVWIAGNHDPAPPSDLGGRVEEELVEGCLAFRHEAAETGGAGELSGHFHPKARVKLRALGLSARCFVGDGRRLILPAFGAFAGGLDVLSPAIRRLFPEGFEVALLGRRAVYRFPASQLLPIA